MLVGCAFGIGGYTFLFARGASYLTNNPAACANCHVMKEQFDGWTKSSHRTVASCNDCHTPARIVPKYATKAANGFWHSYAFTTGWFHEPIQITTRNHNVTENACRKCHQVIVQAIDTHHDRRSSMSCVRCHPSVGHLH